MNTQSFGQPSPESLVLLVGNVHVDGVVGFLQQCGRQYKRKSLCSSPSNWESIVELFDNFSVTSALVQLNGQSYKNFEHPDYSTVAQAFLQKLNSVPHMVFVYESLYTGKDIDWEDDPDKTSETFNRPHEVIREKVNSLLTKHEINIVNYRRNSEITIQAQQFLRQVESGLLMRLYVPNSQLWANETDRLLQLFRDYLTRISGLAVRLDEVRTNSGVIYELHGAPQTQHPAISDEFHEFTEFLDLCISSPESAEMVLKARKVGSSDILQILTRYAKEAKRLNVDIRHDREQKVLRIRQRLEAELLDAMPSDISLVQLNQLVEVMVPTVLGQHSPLMIGASASTTIPQNITFNFNPQIIDRVNGIVAQEVSGDVSTTENDKELMRLFHEHAGQKKLELVSQLRELSDASAPLEGRLTAKQRIKSFLFGLGSKVTDAAIQVLTSYVENKYLGN